jgi:hypothetical protein
MCIYIRNDDTDYLTNKSKTGSMQFILLPPFPGLARLPEYVSKC